jgi:hypothetical protein
MFEQTNGINTANPNGQLQWRRNMDNGTCECFVSMSGAFGFVKYNQAPGLTTAGKLPRLT